MALAEKAADFGRFGRRPPAAQAGTTPHGAGISGKKKGPENIRALQVGGNQEYERLSALTQTAVLKPLYAPVAWLLRPDGDPRKSPRGGR